MSRLELEYWLDQLGSEIDAYPCRQSSDQAALGAEIDFGVFFWRGWSAPKDANASAKLPIEAGHRQRLRTSCTPVARVRKHIVRQINRSKGTVTARSILGRQRNSDLTKGLRAQSNASGDYAVVATSGTVV